MAKRRGLFIGVNHYDENSNLTSLQWAEDDARQLAEVFEQQFGFRNAVLTGSDATRDNIEKELNRCKKDEPGELFAFFFAGHGTFMDNAYNLYPSGSTLEGDGAMQFIFNP